MSGASQRPTVADLLRLAPVPELLARLVLAETLDALAREGSAGAPRRALDPAALRLGGASPARLVADCPRDPRVQLARAAWQEGSAGPPASAAADVQAAAAIAATLVGESASAPLAGLLLALGAEDPAARPSLDDAAYLARALALDGLASWEESRQRAEQAARRSAPEPELDAVPATLAGLPPVDAAPAGESTPAGEGAERALARGTRAAVGAGMPQRSTAVTVAEWTSAASEMAAASPALAVVASSIWMGMGPLGAASLLSALVVTVLLLGS